MLDTRLADDTHSAADTRLADDTALRCEALADRVAATAIGRNAHALKVALAECDALEHGAASSSLVCKLRDLRHWLRLAYGDTLHGYPPTALRAHLLEAIECFRRAVQDGIEARA